MKKFSLIGLGLGVLFLYGCDSGEGTASVIDEPITEVETEAETQTETSLDDFAQCLTDKGARFYGTEWCSHCQAQKALFGESLEKVTFIDCDKNKAECQGLGITGYPTWTFADKSQAPGRQTLEKLAAKTGCDLPS